MRFISTKEANLIEILSKFLGSQQGVNILLRGGGTLNTALHILAKEGSLAAHPTKKEMF
jgi:hypothetical protein